MKWIQCVVCEHQTNPDTGCCTNRCCKFCHGQYCTAGGSDSPGHGLDLEKAREHYRSAPKQ